MGTRDPRVDAYIAKVAPFARPILAHLREVIHAAAPGCAENIKWNAPFFEQEGIVCMMAAFKAHVTFGFWKGALVFDSPKEQEAFGQFGRLQSVADLPPDRQIAALVKKAVALNLAGEKVVRPIKHPKKAIAMPADFGAGLKKNAAARKTFDALPPSGQRDYLEWITEAKSEETRNRRLATSLEWLAEGKPRMWKYQTKVKDAKSAKAAKSAPTLKTKPAKSAKPAMRAPAAKAKPAKKR